MEAAFSWSYSVSFTLDLFLLIFYSSLLVCHFCNQSLKSSGVLKPRFVSSERTVMCSKLGQAGVQQGVLSAEFVLFMGETCSFRPPSLVRGIHGYVLVPEGKVAWKAE